MREKKQAKCFDIIGSIGLVLMGLSFASSNALAGIYMGTAAKMPETYALSSPNLQPEYSKYWHPESPFDNRIRTCTRCISVTKDTDMDVDHGWKGGKAGRIVNRAN